MVVKGLFSVPLGRSIARYNQIKIKIKIRMEIEFSNRVEKQDKKISGFLLLEGICNINLLKIQANLPPPLQKRSKELACRLFL